MGIGGKVSRRFNVIHNKYSVVKPEDGEEYIGRYSPPFVDGYWIRAYAKTDLLQGIVAPVTMLEAENRHALSPSYLIYTGD